MNTLPDIAVRAALLPADTQPIREINMSAWEKSAYATIYSRPERELVYLTLAKIVGDWEEGSTLLEIVIASTDGKDVAISALKRLPNGEGLVEPFYVHPDNWRKGVGTAFWRWIMERFRTVHEAHVVKVYSLDRNDQAKSFYRSVCGEPTGVKSVAHLIPLKHDEPAIEFRCR